jgi:two-component system, OmpR family, sensor histidine kinase CiaH
MGGTWVPPMIFQRVRRRLGAINALAMTVVIAALGAGVVLLMDNLLMLQEGWALQSDSARLDPFDARRPTNGDGTLYLVWDRDGTLESNPNDLPASSLRPQAMQALDGASGPVEVDLPGDRDVLVYSRPFDRGTVLQAARPLQPVRDVEQAATIVVAAASAGAVLLILGVSWFLAGRALVPIRQALERQQQFTADASHELRTPLSVVDAGIQVLRRHPDQTIGQNRDVLDSIRDETQRMSRLVGGLLALARADSGQAEISPAPVDVDQLIGAAARELEPLAAARRSRVQVLGPGAGGAIVDADRFKQLVLILVDNALTHPPAGGTAEVSCLPRDRSLVLEVADRGPGIPPEEREKVFQRFYRLDASRSGPGTGLGLSIARWIVTAHGGSIVLLDNRPGLRVRVTLPAGRPETVLYRPDPAPTGGG